VAVVVAGDGVVVGVLVGTVDGVVVGVLAGTVVGVVEPAAEKLTHQLPFTSIHATALMVALLLFSAAE
jgi:tetrahydromethanopterin S-methyltransferase subunit C